MAKKLGKTETWIVIAFIVLFLFFAAKESEALEFEGGIPYISTQNTDSFMVMLSEREGKWVFGGGYFDDVQVNVCPRPDCEFNIEPNIFFQVSRVVNYKNWEMGLGPAYFQNTSLAVGTNLNWNLSIGYGRDRWAIRLRHWSNAGSGSPNHGYNVVTLGYKF